MNVKLVFPCPDWPLSRQTPRSSGCWGEYKFFINDRTVECDYFVVLDYLLKEKEAVSCPPKNTILVAPELPIFANGRHDKRFVGQFHHLITCHRGIVHPNITYFLPGLPWFVNKDYDFLAGANIINKTKKISIISSNKQFSEGHIKRLRFCTALKDYFGDAVDFFGKGIRDFSDKWDVLAPYQYSVAIENDPKDDWLTEKLYDCFLSHTFPLYYGCPNAEKYFSNKSFFKIDIADLNGAKALIGKILNDDKHYEESLRYLIEAKNRYLQNYNIFPLIVNFIESKQLNPGASHRTIEINNYTNMALA